MKDAIVAVYWDFENIHLGLTDQTGHNGFAARYPALDDVDAIMDYVYSLGVVAVNRAFANWLPCGAYRETLLQHAIDLIQLFPRGQNSKNGADIRLALDALEDVHTHKHISHVMIVGGDSDYIAVAQKLKQAGRTVIGVGVRKSTNRFWTRSCDEFKFYETLVQAHRKEAAPTPLPPRNGDFARSREVLVKAVEHLREQTGEDWVLMSRVRPMMKRLFPEFDPGNYGLPTLADFIAECQDLVTLRQGEHDKLVSIARPPPGRAA